MKGSGKDSCRINIFFVFKFFILCFNLVVQYRLYWSVDVMFSCRTAFASDLCFADIASLHSMIISADSSPRVWQFTFGDLMRHRTHSMS